MYYYLFFLIPFLVASLEVTAEDQCDNNNSTQCMCLYADDYEYQCPPSDFSVLIRAVPEDHLNLDCYDVENFNIDILPTYISGNLSKLVIRFCPLPENTFLPFLKKFDIQSIIHFQLDNVSLPANSSSETISKSLFYGLSGLEALTMSRVPNELDRDLLDYLPNLAQFHLENSGVADLTNFMFPSTLKVLHLTGNALTEIPERIFQHLTDLKQLHLWRNKIAHVKRDYFIGLKSLRSLELSLNVISSIDEDSFADLVELKTINLRANQLHRINSTIFKHNSKLFSIRLEDNPYLSLPDKLFANLQELSIVKINNAGIDVLPERIFENSYNINQIDMQRNRIKNIPEGIFKKLSALKILDLSSNRIDSFPDTVFSDLTNLQTLNLENNKVSHISKSLFKTTKNLTSLSLRNNILSNIDVEAFVRLNKLTFIDLSSNLYELDYRQASSPFALCESLETIILTNNLIKEFPPLGTLVNIKEIDLSYNKMKSIQVAELTSLTSQYLNKIDLSHNEIAYVDFQIVESQALLNLKDLDAAHNTNIQIAVDLRDNPLACDCGNYNLVRYCQDKMIPGVKAKINLIVEGVTCSKPDIYRHIDVTDLKPEDIYCKIQHKYCPKECQCYWRPYTDYLEIDCSYRNLTYFPRINISDKKLQINLDGNYIRSGLSSGMGYENVKNLILSNNKLEELKWIPLGIEILKLDRNALTHLDPELLQIMNKTVNLTTIQLSNNPWTCGCSALDLQIFIRDHYKKVNSTDVFCREDHKLLIEKTDLCKSSTALIMMTVLPILAFLLLTVVGLILYIYYRQEVKVWLFAKSLCLWFVTEAELDEDKKYDIFISYSNQDEEFVMQNLLPVLESGPKPFKTCIHIRDWEPGEMIMTHVTNSVLNSRRTLVVLSNNFLDSVWGIQEFKTAHTQAIKEGRARVIVVKYGDLDESRLDEDLKAYLNTNTYVEWGKPWFWNKLKFALPHSHQNGYYRSNQRHVNVMLQIDDKFELTSPPLRHPESTPPVITLDPALLKNHPLNFHKVNGVKVPSAETPLVFDA